MRDVVFLELGGGLLAVLACIALLRRYRRRRGERAAAVGVREPRSLVEVLTTTAQLEAAAHRAASFEREAASRAEARATHYEAMAGAGASVGYSDNVHLLSNATTDAQRSA